MNRNVTTEETKKLFEFCHSHYVNYYDLQVELVDHLASAIEEKWKTKPDLSFNEALNSTFKKFGIYGFSKIKNQRKRELKRKYNRLLWNFFTEYYRWPKVLMTFILTFALFILFQIVENTMLIVYAYLSAISVFVVVYFFTLYKKFKIKTRKKFMLIEHLQGVLGTLLIISIQIPNLVFQLILNINNNTIKITNPLILMGISLAMVASGILIYGQSIYIPKKIKQHFKSQFPEFALQ
ncbi:MAG: hypothetical protein ACOCWD_00400 [Tangfeifania sp.]